MIKSIFRNLDLNNFDQTSLDLLVNENLITSSVYLSFSFTKRRKIVLYQLYVKVDGKTRNLLSDGKAIKSSNGNLVIQLGEFEPNKDLEIKFEILGVTAVPNIVAVIYQNNQKKATQVLPKKIGDTQKIERGTPPLKGNIKYNVK
ncbi:hypothetical protein POV27_09425 [Aureisphaera galaxeae]|uniref:hypothetical protein n=1 Tax=Aureisphaera galaxeae TaxID=1538023 RepID=UPI0023508FDA|nr:hypothetical protein [Aureisphaera galaxeae]MDC8004270.1 hypothetical protein [Aureisphaera galaxeae]